MPSRPVLIGRGLVSHTLYKGYKDLLRCSRPRTDLQRHKASSSSLETSSISRHAREGSLRKSYGGHGERETPGPIPNPEVKPFSADGTATERLWESRTPPDILLTRGHPLRVAPGVISGVISGWVARVLGPLSVPT